MITKLESDTATEWADVKSSTWFAFKGFIPLLIMWICTFPETFFPIAAFVDKQRKRYLESRKKGDEDDDSENNAPDITIE